MIKVIKYFSLPLLLKELIEQASRRRTYLVRIVYVTLFFLACMAIIIPEYARTSGGLINMLGIGRNIFVAIIGWQFAGIYLFLPALTCSVITVEKERNTLGLLFLTRLSSWTIIIEKLLSRLLPMYFLLLCSLPLLAFSISLGGVTTPDILVGVWFLTLTAFQVGSIAVACSSFFRTTTAALLACYATLFVVGFGPAITDWLVLNNAIRDNIRLIVQEWSTPGNTFTNYDYVYPEIVLFCFVGYAQFMMQIVQRQAFPSAPWFTLVRGLPLILSAIVPLCVARFFLVRRAFVAPRNLLLLLLRRIDRIFHALNENRLTRGIIVLDERSSEPGFSPIAWRETHKRSLGQTSYLIRVLLALEIPVLLIIMTTIFQVADNYYDGGSTMSMLTSLVWLIVALLVTVTSAGVISGERGRQTLDILLTLPMTGRQIILDKIAGVRRLTWICAVPLVTSICFEGWWRDVVGNRFYDYSRQHLYVWWVYEIVALSMVATYLPLLSWLAIYIGLKTRSATRATLTALIVVVAWCVVPLVCIYLIWEWCLRPAGYYGSLENNGTGFLLQFSPLGLLVRTEAGALSSDYESWYGLMLLNLAIYGSACLVIRYHVLKHADRLLGRTKPSTAARRAESQAPKALPAPG